MVFKITGITDQRKKWGEEQTETDVNGFPTALSSGSEPIYHASTNTANKMELEECNRY